MKNKIAKSIANLLPNRVMYWAIIRAYAYTTVHSFPEKTPDEIGFSDLAKSWETKTDLLVTDDGYVKRETVDVPNL